MTKTTSTATRYLVSPDGTFIGAVCGCIVHHPAQYISGEEGDPVLVAEAWEETLWPDMPAGAIEAPTPPSDGRQVWDGKVWTWPMAMLLEHLADLRWRRETGGITVNGMSVDTDRDAQSMLTGAAMAAQMEGDAYELRWKAPTGFVNLTAGQVIALARAVRAHVQACFDAEASISERITAGEITTLADLEAATATALPPAL